MGPKGLNWSTALEDFCFLFKFPGCAVRAQSKSKGESAQNHQNPAPNSGESCQNHPESRNREICEIPKFQKNVYSRGESLLLPCPIRCELTAERSLCCVRVPSDSYWRSALRQGCRVRAWSDAVIIVFKAFRVQTGTTAG